MKTVNLEEILENIFEPSSQDCSTTKQDLQLAITLNPDLDKIINAMCEACNQALELAAEEQAKYYSELGFTSTGKKINDSILNLKSQII